MGIASAAGKAPGSSKPSKAPRPQPVKSAPIKRGSLPNYFELPSDATETPAYRYAQLSRSECEGELKARQISFKRESARGVLAPIRLTGPLSGVLFRGEGTDAQRAQSLHEIVDCRLVLALHDSVETLREHDIVEVRHYSMYRLPSPSWPRGKPADRHMGAVAIDAGKFYKKDGTVLDVDRHFHGRIGSKTCGAGARPKPATAQSLELRKLLCKLVARRLFTVVLTPNYNVPHKNHFHLEVAAGKKWFLVH